MSQAIEASPVRVVDFTEEAIQADPYPVYAELREVPVQTIEGSRGFRTYWVGRYQEVATALRDPRFRVEKGALGDMEGEGVPEAFQRLGAQLQRMMLLRDAPDHTRLRGLVNKAFTPRVVQGLRPRIESIVHGLVELSVGEGRLEVIADLATPLPVIVIAELLGVPAADHARFKEWSDRIAVVIDGSIRLEGLPAAADAAAELTDYLRHAVAARRREPREDLLSGLAAARDEDDSLSEDELVANAILILLAGHETTTNLIGNGLLALGSCPEAWSALHRDPGLAVSAVEEALRYDAPVQLTSRMTREIVELGATKLEPGVEVGLSLGSANRDPARFPEPDRFLVGRAPNRHLSFGLGAHFCLGAPLARLECEVLFGALAERLPRLRVEHAGVRRRPGFLLRGLATLPVSL